MSFVVLKTCEEQSTAAKVGEESSTKRQRLEGTDTAALYAALEAMRPRTGLLFDEIATPCPLFPGSRLTADLLSEAVPNNRAACMHTLTAWDQLRPESVPSSRSGTIKGELGLSDFRLFMTQREETHYEAPGPTPKDQDFTTLWAPNGRKQMTCEAYMKTLAMYKPDCAVALMDEIPPGAGANRQRVSCDKSIAWIDKCLKLKEELGMADTLLFGGVVGGASTEDRARVAKEVGQRQGLDGFVLAGFGLGESPKERQALIRVVLAELPPEKPRVLWGGADGPADVLVQVASGVDLFDAAYPIQVAEQCCALVFPLSFEGTLSSAGKLNLLDNSFKTDKRPLVEGCQCFVCTRHHRGYINHLLNAQEMLAKVLLEMHNLHYYGQFFEHIRLAIDENRFDDYMRAHLAWRARGFIDP